MDEDGAANFSELDGESSVDVDLPEKGPNSPDFDVSPLATSVQASDSVTSTESSLQSSHKKVTFDDAYVDHDTIPEESVIDDDVVEVHENNVPYVDANTIDPEDIRFVSVYDLPQPWKIRRMTEVSSCVCVSTVDTRI